MEDDCVHSLGDGAVITATADRFSRRAHSAHGWLLETGGAVNQSTSNNDAWHHPFALVVNRPKARAIFALASHPKSQIRHQVLFSLLHSLNKPGVFETYLRARDDPDHHVRHFALSSLARYPDADPALLLPIGLDSAKSTNKYDRWAAMYILARFKTNHPAGATLSNALTDPDSNVRSVATRVLE